MRNILIFFCMTLLLIVSACSQDDAAENNTNGNTNASENTEEMDKENDEETEYPLEVTDATGETVTFEEEPKRIISASPSETEILFALGLDEEIYGVSDFDNYPEEAKEKTTVGGVVDPNAEAIIDEEPDLVVTGVSIEEEVTEKLREFDLPAYKTDADSVKDILENIKGFGIITNKQKEAKELVSDMEEDIKDVEEHVADIAEEDKKKVYIEYSPGWTVGEGEFMDELIEIAGAENVAHDTEGYSEVDEEKIIKEDPDVIIYASDLVDDDSEEELGDLIKDRSGWGEITAIEDDQMVGIEEDIMSRPGPRVTQALKEMAEGIYPKAFED